VITTGPLDLSSGEGKGPLWGLASEDLNATLLAWPRGGGVSEQVNEERDVLLIVVARSCWVWLDGVRHYASPRQAVLVEKGRGHRLLAGEDGVRYLSVHVRRPPLQIRAPAA